MAAILVESLELSAKPKPHAHDDGCRPTTLQKSMQRPFFSQSP